MRVLNFGSLNIDYTYNVDHIIVEGETLSATKRNVYCGGKGLNQSIALSRAGVDVCHAGSVGKVDGIVLLEELKKSKVCMDFVRILEDTPSGHTFIQVDKSGANCILVYGGANQQITVEQIDETLLTFSKNDILLLQNEINNCSYIMESAFNKGMKIVLNPSPFDEKIKDLPLEYVDFFMVNEIEAKQFIDGDSEKDILDEFTKTFPNSHIVMTVGKNGAYYAYRNDREYHDVFDVEVIDTTGAGDTFTGYFVSSFIQNKHPYECLRIASAASSIAVSHKGASASIPNLHQVYDFLSNY